MGNVAANFNNYCLAPICYVLLLPLKIMANPIYTLIKPSNNTPKKTYLQANKGKHICGHNSVVLNCNNKMINYFFSSQHKSAK